MPTHYEFTGETLEHKGRILYRIRATSENIHAEPGTLGGWIESEHNLQDRGWVADEAKVYDDAEILDDATVRDYAEVFGHAVLLNTACAYGSAQVCDSAILRMDASIGDSAIACNNARIDGLSGIEGSACMSGGLIDGLSHLRWPIALPSDVEIYRADHVFAISEIGLYGVRTTTGSWLNFQTQEITPAELCALLPDLGPYLLNRISSWHKPQQIESTPCSGTSHFRFTGETCIHDGRTLHRIIATAMLPHHEVHLGELGGWIESEHNLQDRGWVADEAKVYDNATVRGFAHVSGNAQIFGHAVITDWATICDQVSVSGKATIGGHTACQSNARIYGHTTCTGDSIIGASADCFEPDHVVHLDQIIPGCEVFLWRTLNGYHATDRHVILDPSVFPKAVRGFLASLTKTWH